MKITITEDVLKEIETKFNNGISLRKLEKEFNINRKIISQALKDKGYKFSREYSEDIKNQAIKLYQEGKSITSISKQLNIDRHQLSLNLQKWKIRKQKEPQNHIGIYKETELSLEIKNRYINRESIASLAKSYHKSTNYIYRVLNKYDICELRRTRREYNYDSHIFQNIDTEEKAYWLGFLYADGCITKRNGNNFYSEIEIGLQYTDLDHLKKFVKFISPKKDIPIKIKINTDSNGNKHKSCYLKINNIKMANDLIKNGCTPKKSLTLTFPSKDIVPKHLLPHFIRGAFDGDGSVYYHIDKRRNFKIQLAFSYISSLEFCKEMQRVLVENCIVHKYTKLQQNGKAFMFCYCGNKQCKKIFKYLYSNATVYLQRKFEKFIAVLGRNT